MLNSKNIYLFDFDGVICDSTDECMITAWNAWQKLLCKKNFKWSTKEFSKNEKKAFRKHRTKVKGGGEYYILFRAFQENIHITDQKKYNLLVKLWKPQCNSFASIFYKMRKKFQKKSIKAWVLLHPIYKDIIKILKQLSKNNQCIIATLKDRYSVEKILSNWKIKIAKKYIFDNSKIKSKIDCLELIRQQKKLSKKYFTLIDDNIMHLLPPKRNGYRVWLVQWVNYCPESVKMAKRINIPVFLSQKALAKKINSSNLNPKPISV